MVICETEVVGESHGHLRVERHGLGGGLVSAQHVLNAAEAGLGADTDLVAKGIWSINVVHGLNLKVFTNFCKCKWLSLAAW